MLGSAPSVDLRLDLERLLDAATNDLIRRDPFLLRPWANEHLDIEGHTVSCELQDHHVACDVVIRRLRQLASALLRETLEVDHDWADVERRHQSTTTKSASS